MRSSLFILVATSAGIAAPVPKPDKADGLYFPVQVGAKRVTTGPGRTETVTVTKVEEKDGRYAVTVETSFAELPGRTRGCTYEVSKDGLILKTDGGKAETLLKLPYKEGTTWTSDNVKPGDTLTYTVGKREEVEVPAGRYKAIGVEVVLVQAGGETKKATYWYAAGVGLIKEGANELKEFTPGRADGK